MRTRLLLLFILSGMLQSLYAQYSDPDYSSDDFFREDSSAFAPIETLNLFGAAKPTPYKSLKQFLPPALNLMDSRTPPASAVIWAFTYQAMSIQYRSELRQPLSFSYSYIFNKMSKKNDCRFTIGAINELSRLLKSSGTVLSADFKQPAECQPISTSVPQTQHYKLKDLYSLFDAQCNEKDPDCISARLSPNKESRIKIVLSQNKPVVALLRVHPNFHLLNREFIEYRKDQLLHAGSKTIVIIGFDDEKQAFEVTFPAGNSWGKNGIALLRYSDLVYVSKAYSLVLDKKMQSIAQTQEAPIANTPSASPAPKVDSTKPSVNQNKPSVNQNNPSVNQTKPSVVSQVTETQNLKADISMNELFLRPNQQVATKPIPLHISEKTVGLKDPVSPDQYYQISIRNLSADSYFYVLNIEKDKKQVHFPINKGASSKSPEVRPVSSYVISESADFYVPRPRTDPDTGNLIPRGFVKKDSEKEYMVLLFSKEKIDDGIRELVDRLAYLPDSDRFYQQLCDALGTKLIPPDLKTADKSGRVQLNSLSSKGTVLPTVITIRGR